ncbi:hypothetical protein [Mariniflexile sp. AS56]|nr:hypothetical protein [Mariniflexile sp. AS56]MDO7173154.1 hypothetical protein [Mariniflexile sp. AS56]
MVAPEGFKLDYTVSYAVGIATALIVSIWFLFGKPVSKLKTEQATI